MVRIIEIMLTFIIICCSVYTREQKKSDFDYLIGNWERTNGTSGNRTFERWTKNTDDSYSSISIMTIGQDTVYKETVHLEKQGDNFFYITNIPQNLLSTKFKVVELRPDGFRAVDPNNDFPKEIQYEKVDEANMTATISGNGKRILYQFEKRN